MERRGLEQNGRRLCGTDLWRGDVLHTSTRLIVCRIEFDQEGLLARLPFFQLTENRGSQPAAGHVEAIHADAPVDRCLLLRFVGRSAVDTRVGYYARQWDGTDRSFDRSVPSDKIHDRAARTVFVSAFEPKFAQTNASFRSEMAEGTSYERFSE